MLIVVDSGLPDAEAAFEPFGRVISVPGREIGAEHVRDADALIVRSVSRVGPALLDGSKVRFIGTATTGTDHVDIPWLEENGIAFASAAGCNARTVAEYVFAAILEAACRLHFDPLDQTLGVVGVGRIGSIVADWAERIGLHVLRCDPPLAEKGGGPFVTPHEIAEQADIITLHVPLTTDGPHATLKMIDAAWFARLSRRPVYINTSRGDIVDEAAFRAAAAAGALRFAVVDVWRDEPHIDPQSLAAADIATPHIAGYSKEARDRAVAMIAGALAAHTQKEPINTGQNANPPPDAASPAARCDPESVIPVAPASPWWKAAASAASRVLDLAAIDARLRAAVSQSAAESFDDIRLSLARRREFPHYKVSGADVGPCERYLTSEGFRAS